MHWSYVFFALTHRYIVKNYVLVIYRQRMEIIMKPMSAASINEGRNIPLQ